MAPQMLRELFSELTRLRTKAPGVDKRRVGRPIAVFAPGRTLEVHGFGADVDAEGPQPASDGGCDLRAGGHGPLRMARRARRRNWRGPTCAPGAGPQHVPD